MDTLLTLELLCRHVRVLTRCPVQIYDSAGSLTDGGGDGRPQPMDTDEALREQLFSLAGPDLPGVLHEDGCAVYGAVALPDGGRVILGPACYDLARTRKVSQALARRHGMPPESAYQMSPVPLYIFTEGLLLLFHAVNPRRLSRNELAMLNGGRADPEEESMVNVAAVIDELRESGFRHNPYDQELREQQAIRDGDPEGLRRSWDENFEGSIGRLADEPVRHYRNLAINNIAVASRTAIEGGVPAEIAFSMSDAFIQETERLNQPAQLVRLFRTAQLSFAEAVAKYRSSDRGSPLVSRCKELVHQMLHQRFTVRELAEALGVNYAYLSDLFAKREGVRLSAYILREKVTASRYQLLHTRDSLDEIAATYGFSSQSHYGQTFKRWMGMSPGEYRSRGRQGSAVPKKPTKPEEVSDE